MVWNLGFHQTKKKRRPIELFYSKYASTQLNDHPNSWKLVFKSIRVSLCDNSFGVFPDVGAETMKCGAGCGCVRSSSKKRVTEAARTTTEQEIITCLAKYVPTQWNRPVVFLTEICMFYNFDERGAWSRTKTQNACGRIITWRHCRAHQGTSGRCGKDFSSSLTICHVHVNSAWLLVARRPCFCCCWYRTLILSPLHRSRCIYLSLMCYCTTITVVLRLIAQRCCLLI